MNLFSIHAEIERPDLALVKELSAIPTANLSDAMANLNTMSSGIQAMTEGAGLCGPALTVACRSGDFLAILKGLDAARPGDVLVLDNQGGPDVALWGEITTTEAKRKGLAGLVVDGLVRDVLGIRRMNFAVFARGTSPRVAGRSCLGEVNVAVQCGGVVVHPGDIVAGDSDGVVVVPRHKAADVLALARSIVKYEEELLSKVAAGESQVEIFRLDEQFQELLDLHQSRK